MRLVVIGATGFLGRAVCEHAHAKGITLLRVARGRRRGASPPDLYADGSDSARIANHLRASDTIINLVGLSPLAWPRGGRAAYGHAHIDVVRGLIEAARMAGVGRLIHLTALGVRPDTGAPYAETKARAERLINYAVAAGHLDRAIIVQPSILIGPGGELAGLFRRLVRLPVIGSVVPIPLPTVDAPFRPVCIRDAAESIIGLALEGMGGRASGTVSTVPLVGPELLSMTRVAERACRAAGRKSVRLPSSLSHAAISVVSRVRVPGLPADLDRMLSIDNAGPAEAGAKMQRIDWRRLDCS